MGGNVDLVMATRYMQILTPQFLDEVGCPMINDVVRVDHRHTVEDLARLGTDVERITLSRAVRWHCEDRVIGYDNQTVVF